MFSANPAPAPIRGQAYTPEPITQTFVSMWLGFCVLMVLVGLQEHWTAGLPGQGWRLVDELTSMATATGFAVVRWRAGPRLDAYLHRPREWFSQVLRWTPLAALLFVVLVYGARQALRSALGVHFSHPPWSAVLAYECLKFSVFYLLFAGVQFGLRSYRALATERLRSEQLQHLSGQARMLQLTQQMQPHFLFNALNTIAALVHESPQRADALLQRLAALLRATTDVAQRPQHTLADELALARGYAELMAERFGERVTITWQIDPAALACLVPTLALQTLLENAFVHAVERRLAPTHIEVSAQFKPGRLRLQVVDDGGSLAADWADGVGLGNLRQRLQVLYGDAARLHLQARPGGGVAALIEWPCELPETALPSRLAAHEAPRAARAATPGPHAKP